MENAIPAQAPQRLPDVILVVCRRPGRTCAESGLMLARVRPSGLFELLSADAWAHALGYRPEELSGKPLRELVHEKPATCELVAALLYDGDTQPLDVTLRCKDERRKFFRLHRRFDPYDRTVTLLADELPQQPAKVHG
ncbi:MAG TPA: PAS domain-containing protein [Burkholderiales bacterium]|nr:PAS domain-containing protein [Burkholderiales bacterium]